MNNTLVSLFPSVLQITHYDYLITKELKYLSKIKYKKNLTNNNYQSDDTYILDNKNLSEIKKFCQNSLDSYTEKVIKTKQKLHITQSWINRNPKNIAHHQHRHPNSILSGVFFFNCVDESPPIVFKKTAQEKFEFDMDSYDLLNSSTFAIKPILKQLLIFPSNLEHQVPMNAVKSERVSLSFNTFADRIGSKKHLTFLNIR
tara:strand:+ start:437 stop:1039 length:603 start_codon:yes stop_codon:yes gene_type:complete